MKEIVDFIKSQVLKSKTKGIVLGLSGGIDSAVVAVLSKRAIGAKNLHCYYLPMTIKNKDYDRDHIEKLCERFDLSYQTETIVNPVLSIIGNSGNLSKESMGNIKARVRMTILYKHANNLNCLVIGTTNKTELMIGYFTKYGDGACDFEPIAHLYKHQIKELAKELDIPNEIIDKLPSAGLWEGQTDEDELGISYDKLDEILCKMYNNDLNEFTKKDIDHVKSLVSKSYHKRHTPPTL